LVRKETRALKALKEPKEQQVLGATQVYPAIQVQQAQRGLKVKKVLLAHSDHKDQLVQQALKDHKAVRVIQVLRDPQEQQGHKDL
jgi:hypothetical protein